MPKCNTCGTANPDGSGYCGLCGAVMNVPRPARGPVHRLRVFMPGRNDSRLVELHEGKWLCGRASDCRLVLEDPYVSPKHAQLSVNGALRLTDLGSTNGTFLRLRGPVTLRSGDELRMGLQFLRFEALPASASAAGGGKIWGSPSQGCRFRLLQIIEGGGVGEAMPLGDGEHLVGREEGRMTFPGDMAMSGRHAVFSIQGDKATLRDLGSSNGTFLRLRGETELQLGDHLLIGRQQIRYEAK
jgi:pSer/pThr/pTyr-binding forkhead associated (FHA) protein